MLSFEACIETFKACIESSRYQIINFGKTSGDLTTSSN